jgi:hypothetical protein
MTVTIWAVQEAYKESSSFYNLSYGRKIVAILTKDMSYKSIFNVTYEGNLWL